LHGRLSRELGAMYNRWVVLSADVEVTLDFSEDELAPPVFSDLEKRLGLELVQLDELISTWNEGRLLREGIRVVIMGLPNSGKSTLFNALLRSDRSIVSHHPGTTRDIIEEHCQIGGYTVRLIDTAGLRESDCEIEREGIRRAISLLDSDVYGIYVVDGTNLNINEEWNYLKNRDPLKTVVTINKSDAQEFTIKTELAEFKVIPVSALTGTGMKELKEGVLALIRGSVLETGAADLSISTRHKDALLRCRERLSEADYLLKNGRESESAKVADLLRDATESLGETIGRRYHDDLLNRIFSEFCIGK
jgi:tRNA modification GTPase